MTISRQSLNGTQRSKFLIQKKTRMRTIIRISIIAISFCVSACNNNVSYEEALNKNREHFEDAKEFADAEFLMKTKSANLLAIKALDLASDTAYSAAIMNFAKSNLEDLKKLDEEIAEVARKKDITLADELSPEHSTLLKQLSSAERTEFDASFIRIVGNINEANTATFTTKATDAYDPDIRAFAARKLDLLRAHSESVSSIRQELLNTSP